MNAAERRLLADHDSDRCDRHKSRPPARLKLGHIWTDPWGAVVRRTYRNATNKARLARKHRPARR